MKTEQLIVETVRHLVGVDYLYLDSPLVVNPGPFDGPTFWAVCISPQNQIYLMDADEQWHQVQPTDVNYEAVLQVLNQRLGLILNRMNKKAV